MFALHRTIPLAALVFGKLIVPRLLSLGQHDGWRLIQLGAAGAVAQRLEAAGWALCFGHGPAGGFFVCPSILLKSIVEEGATESDRTSAAPALLLLPVHARREPASAPVCLQFCWCFGRTQGRPKKAIIEYDPPVSDFSG